MPSLPRRILGHRNKAIIFLITLLCISCLSTALADNSRSISPASLPVFLHNKRQHTESQQPDIPHYSCVVVGECHTCSTLQIQTEPSCRETHNRQRIECKFDDPKDEENEEVKVKLPTYQTCLRVKAVEARRFAHFFSTNIFLALFSGVLVVWRKRKLAAAQYRRMARRIGIA